MFGIVREKKEIRQSGLEREIILFYYYYFLFFFLILRNERKKKDPWKDKLTSLIREANHSKESRTTLKKVTKKSKEKKVYENF